jgi:predicted AlkP superfamily pyrophosphatase or phosphodiesterase
MSSKLLIIEAAALGYDLLRRHGLREMAGLTFQPAETVFPAVTCTVQASFRTAAAPAAHGMISNGLFHRDLRKVMFWEQSARLVAGERIWSPLRRRGGTVGMLFFQQSMGEAVDLLLTPAPIHKHHGGMIEDCYGRPDDLHARLCRTGRMRPFKLRTYWGPLAGASAGTWISEAIRLILGDEQLAPDVLLAYLPTLDYDLQRHGPDGRKAAAALASLAGQIDHVLSAARQRGYEVIVFGDYAMAEVTQPASLPNLALLESGLLRARPVRGMLYADLHESRAFALVDHEVAHVYVREPGDVGAARRVLGEAPGVAKVLDAEEIAARGVRHPNAGELMLVAEEGSWLAYPWWTHKSEAPDYARHVDIHNKPGYDPCELFFGWPPMSVSLDTSRVRGTHGRAGSARRVAWASTVELDPAPATLLELAATVKHMLDEEE